jgi:hypothetical protein
MIVAQTPRDMVDPPKPPTPQRLLTRWEEFLGSIAAGLPLQDAMMKHFVTRAEIEAKCLVPAEQKRWNEARAAARRRNWSVLDLEDVFARIGSGLTVVDAVEAVKHGGYQGFHDVVTNDPELNEQYLKALRLRAMHVGEGIIEIVDDDSKDTLDTGGKSGIVPNNAAVNRSKLKAESRLRLMKAWYPQVWGDRPTTQVNVQINHAEKLENARARSREKRAIPSARGLLNTAIDATFSEVVPAGTTDDPLDTTWMEG